MNKMKVTVRLVLILIVFAALSAEAQITMSLRVSWRTEVSPLDTLRQPINVPYLHVVYRNDSDTNYYLVRRDRPRWIFPYIGFTEDLLQYQENYDYVIRNEVSAMQTSSSSSHRSHSSDPQVDWSECVEYLQYILSCLRAPARRDPHALKVYGQQENLHSVAKEPYKTDGILRLLEGRLAFLPARSEQEYIYSLLAFRMVRGRFHFVIPNWVAKDTTIANEALGMEGDPSKGLSEVKLPRHYEGYQLYRGQVRGDSIWIEM